MITLCSLYILCHCFSQLIKHHTNVANGFGSTIYVEVRGPDGVKHAEHIQAASHISFQTKHGQVTVMVYLNGDQNTVRATQVLKSDQSVIVKNNNGCPVIVLAKYGTIWQEE